jgi:hypothetical protein
LQLIVRCSLPQLAASKAELGDLRSAKAALAEQLECLRGENKQLLQRSALADSLAAEADALRQQARCFVSNVFRD